MKLLQTDLQAMLKKFLVLKCTSLHKPPKMLNLEWLSPLTSGHLALHHTQNCTVAVNIKTKSFKVQNKMHIYNSLKRI